jgi:hypothetical protein
MQEQILPTAYINVEIEVQIGNATTPASPETTAAV